MQWCIRTCIEDDLTHPPEESEVIARLFAGLSDLTEDGKVVGRGYVDCGDGKWPLGGEFHNG